MDGIATWVALQWESYINKKAFLKKTFCNTVYEGGFIPNYRQTRFF